MKFGPWHPDLAGINVDAVTMARNCLPAANGFRPLKALAPATVALGTGVTCLGAAVVYDDDGDISTFAGDETKLYKLEPTATWEDVSRTSGGPYASGSGERWQFASSGGLVIAVTIGVDPQKYLLNSSTDFAALGGTPPKARYIATVGEFVVLGGLFGDERTVHWCGLGNAEHWTPGTQSCDIQTFQNGGPVRGLVGGEVGYVFQAERVNRMTFVPASQTIFQFDEVEGGRGLAAPYSLARWGNTAFYLASDGLYQFSLVGGTSKPLGIGKWADWLSKDIKPGSELTALGGIDPIGRRYVLAYNSLDSIGTALNRVLIYDWALDEATYGDEAITALAQILTQGLTMDTIDAFGSVDGLPFSLDSPAWRGGASLLGIFSTDAKMSFYSGTNKAATFETCDQYAEKRMLIKGVRPAIDTRNVTIAVAAREAEGDGVVYGPAEGMEDTGICSAWASGWLARCRITVAAAANWTKLTALADVIDARGRR